MLQAKILVVDDEPNILDMVATVLEFHGFDVRTAATAAEAHTAAHAFGPDLVVLDVMLPDGDGFDVCRALRRSRPDLGIVFLTAKDAHSERVAGLTYGGDDYVTKPFNTDELVARVRAVLRRTRPGPRPEQTEGLLRFADVELDERACVVRRAGHPVPLSRTEFDLLRYLMLNSGRVLSRPQIIDEVWSEGYSGGSNIVDTYVGYLRRKLGAHGPNLIQTQRGFGYALREGESR
ncbi:DNA-binding response regulator [Nocardiopsis terrae]|uniref:Two-component system OmpR family response regulator n=1 Tax=Nocardiopsis terrae TaxID=372655 RepID=A0ABR9HI53_9ACTN|nr:response regulator transcription factor [Nocardiopsis terrae]MBE1458714.1 two-component system OmpR family response regulator [Nocardiopsis terrae]GHC78917.1 DNA-binding response regulator [Nocardiopsis terrae]